MRGTPKLVMGLTLIMGVTLLLILALVLVLFAELYCSLLRKCRTPPTGNAAATQEGSEEDPPSAAPLLTSLCLGQSPYSHGVLCSPPSGFLFPFIKEQQQQQQQQRHPSGTSLHFMGLISPSALPPPSLALSRCPPAPPRLTTIATAFEEHNSATEKEDARRNSDSAAASGENFIYISNPIYDNADGARFVDTPFETPGTSPSCLPPSDADDPEASTSSPANCTPPLTPMKKLPLMASSVTLMDGRSLIATDSNEGLSSSSSDSRCTSPSW